MCVPFRLTMCAFRFPRGFSSVAYAAPTGCPIMGSLWIPMYSFRNGMNFVSCVYTCICSLSRSLSLSLYLYAFFVSALLSIYLCTFSVGSLLYTDVQGFCIYLICVAHELHTSALWCSCLVPKLIHGVPTGCPM
jgi:hypothetical protein